MREKAEEIVKSWFDGEIQSAEFLSRGYHTQGIEALMSRKDTARLIVIVAQALTAAHAQGREEGMQEAGTLDAIINEALDEAIDALRPEEGERPKNACAFDCGHSCCQPLTKPRPDGDEGGAADAAVKSWVKEG